jgi:DNA repair exonuclease SbcCD nuclease subunit
LVTLDDLSPGQSLPEPIVVAVTDVNWQAGQSRRAVVELVDTAGNPLRLIDYEGAEISIDWKQNHRYRISRCGVQKGGQGFEIDLAPSKKTQIEPLGSTDPTTRLLVVGDTHIGRTTHPRTGEKISPRHALATAIEYGINRDVDAVVHVGDIFHESATSTHADLVDTHVFEPLADANIPFYYITGNHSSSPGDELLKQRTGKLVANLDSSGASVNSQVRVFGIDHHKNGNIPRNDLAFPNLVPEPLSILVLHQTIEQLSGHSPETVDLERITRQFGGQFDFILAGHHHDAYRTDWGDIPIMYTGAAEHMSTNDDPNDRIAWLFTIENNSIACDRYDIP